MPFPSGQPVVMQFANTKHQTHKRHISYDSYFSMERPVNNDLILSIPNRDKDESLTPKRPSNVISILTRSANLRKLTFLSLLIIAITCLIVITRITPLRPGMISVDSATTAYEIITVSDRDTFSKKEDYWASTLGRGTLVRNKDTGMYSITWHPEKVLFVVNLC